MNVIFIVFHVALLCGVVFNTSCCQQKDITQQCLKLHEKKVVDFIKQKCPNLLRDVLVDPMSKVISRQKDTLERNYSDSNLVEIRNEKKMLHNRVIVILDTVQYESLLNYFQDPCDQTLQAQAMHIAKVIVSKKNNKLPKKTETDKQYTERLLQAELNRFIVSTPSRKLSDPICVSSNSSNACISTYYQNEEYVAINMPTEIVDQHIGSTQPLLKPVSVRVKHELAIESKHCSMTQNRRDKHWSEYCCTIQ
ncbi:MAG: hypothetical protein P4L31_06640 [Candidatus Babeliales bacterium]|nr:hypothetical protein [Candidatus Babeliales bacterium]